MSIWGSLPAPDGDAHEARVATLRERVILEATMLEKWAGEQHAGNVFATQVRYQAQSWLAALAAADTEDGT